MGGFALKSDAVREIRMILGMIIVVAAPVLLTLATVRVPLWELEATDNPTPFGYTVSLLIFIVPVAVIGVWHMIHGDPYDKKAFVWCAALMTTLGVFLDLAFGYSFFEFPNQGATLGIRVPAWDWGEMAWVPDYLPLEEFGFYVFGSVFMMAAYLWADSAWLARYDPDSYTTKAREHLRILQISPQAAALFYLSFR